MADERLHAAADLLSQHYGRTDLQSYRSGWRGLVRFVLERILSPKKFDKCWPELEESWLMTVDEVARSKRTELFELLEAHGVSESTMALLHRLAVWWQSELDAGRTPFDVSRATLESNWEELARHDQAIITRLFCVVGGLQKFPMTRGIWRVACRHSWLSWYDDASEIPESFAASVDGLPYELGQLAEWFIRVGEDFCGTKPKCSECPLRSLLGPAGPSEPDES